MSDHAPLFPEDAPGASAIVTDDIPCIQCGYNLRMTHTNARCPECGTDVSLSLGGDWLSNADGFWVTALARGVSLIVVADVLQFISVVIYLLTHSTYVMVGLAACNATLEMLGYWFITSPEPRAWRSEAGATVRNVLRMLALAEYATRLLGVAGTLSQSAILQNVARFTQLIGLVTLVLYYILLTRICRRIPHQPLARQFRRIMFGFSISLGVVLVLGLVMTMLPRGMGGGPGPALLVSALVACPALVALIVFGLWSFVAQVRLRRELAIVAITARARAGNPA